MMGNRSLSFKFKSVFVISFLLCYEYYGLVNCGGDIDRTKRDLHTDFGSFDLHLKTGSSRQTKHISSSDNQYSARGRGDQVQGLVDVESYDKSHRKGQKSKLQNVQPPSYIGCFSTWEKQYTSMIYSHLPTYYVDNGPVSCAEKCRQINGEVMMLRGFECQCALVYAFDSMKVDDHLCHLPCPSSNYNHASTEPVHYPCGGDLGYSIYCLSDSPGNCSALVEKYKPEVITIKRQEQNINSLIINDPCVTCDGGNQRCRKMGLHPEFDYFPTNSPRKCIEFCGRDVNYVGIGANASGLTNERVRKATPYARLTWWWFDRVFIPICACVPAEDRALYEPASLSVCNAPCPGEPAKICGGRPIVSEVYKELYSTLYCVNPETGPCQEWDGIQRPPSSSTSTTIKNEVDPCDLEEFDCDDPFNPIPGSSTEEDGRKTTEAEEDSTTTTPGETTTTSSTEPPTTPTPGETSPSTEYTTTSSTPSTVNTTTMTTTPRTTTNSSTPRSTTTTSTTTPTPASNSTTLSTTLSTSVPTTSSATGCSVECNALDRYGHTWKVCAKSRGSILCSKLIPNSVGRAFWSCSRMGEFETANPDVSNCSSSWIEEKEEAVENIRDFNEADQFMESLSGMTRNSSSNYFGHEIRNVTGLIDKVLSKSREFTPDFSKLEGMIEKAVNLNSFLIQHQQPWSDLNAKDRSTISTDLMESMDGVLFHLTDAVKDAKNYQQVFKMDNETDLLRFLVLAEAFDKLQGGIDKDYEFPPKKNRSQQDSYIKLPEGWKKQVKKDKVEVAAMSIDPEYVSFIMPGQYEHLKASSNIDDEDNSDQSKLINGRLISLSVSTENEVLERSGVVSQSPRVTFTEKGAEITFHHDIEAWGSEKQNVHRKLHEGEKPRAVLGSTECVFWDTNKHVWSSKGCKILRSNRYETVCECSHLTSFAVLMDVHRYVGKEFGLELLTLILCPASEVALALSIIILSSVNGLQRIRSMITTNLSICLLIGNALVLFVLDRNYFHMGEGLCIGAAMITHYIFMCAFMWMLIEGIQLYRMVVHVFDSGRSYIKHFGLVAYGSPLIIIAATATTGYLRGDKPYGGDVYCWLEGPYIWSFMGPVALIILVNMTILFIALKTAYQLQQTKKLSPTFLMGRIRSCKTWFKGCFSLTVILGLTWAVGFFLLMKGTGGVVFAYIFTVLNASQGIFIFLFNCVFNDKVRAYAQRNLSTYLPSWITSSSDSSEDNNGKDASIYAKRRLSPEKNSVEKLKKRTSQTRYITDNVNLPNEPFTIPSAKIVNRNDPPGNRIRGSLKVDFIEATNNFPTKGKPIPQRSESVGTISSVDSIPASSASENGHVSSDTSQNALISKLRANKNI